jgi:hypothetical protein
VAYQRPISSNAQQQQMSEQTLFRKSKIQLQALKQ